MASGISREEIEKAILSLRDFCRGFDEPCNECPLGGWGDNTGCHLALKVPSDWDIPWESEEEGGGE